MSTPKDNKLREAGLLEKFHLIRVNGEFDTCVLSAAKYTSPTSPNHRLTRPTVLRALRHLILTHASLSAYATSPPPPPPPPSTSSKSDKKTKTKTKTKVNPYELVFRRLNTVNLSDLVTFDAYPGKTLQEVIKAELETPLPNGKTVVEGSESEGECERLKPLWRVKVLEDGQTVVFAWHHAIGDGSSGFALHRSFLDALNSQSSLNSSSSSGVGETEEELIITPPQDLTMIQPTEALTSVAVSWRTFFVALYETFAPKSWLKGYTAWTGNLVGSPPPSPPSSSSPSSSDNDEVKFAAAKSVNVRIQTIPSQTGKALVALCRANGTTLTAFLHTLAVLSLSETLHTTGEAELGEKWKTFSTSIPVSLRRFTGASGYDICDHVSNFHFYPPISPASSQPILELSNQTFPWPTAQSLSTHLRSPALLAGTKETIGTIRYLFDLGIAKDFFSGKVGGKRGYSFEVSNLGVLSQPDSPKGIAQGKGGKEGETENKWNVEDVYFAQNDGTCGAAIKINVAGVSSSGTISVVYTWGEGAVDESVAEGFVERMSRGVERVLG